MNLKDLDIVYFIKDAAYNEELRYSLRSVEKNFPHNRVWFYGGKPCGLVSDRQVVVDQKGETKWDRVRNMMKMVVENNEITEDFVLFNDDFFVLKKRDRIPCYENGLLVDLIYRIERKNNFKPTPYTAALKRTLDVLYDTTDVVNFELHLPMIFNRKKMAEVIEKYPGIKGTRSLYGNSYVPADEYCRTGDVKIFNLEDLPDPDWDFCSTEDMTFNDGNVGRYIRKMFPDKSRFER